MTLSKEARALYLDRVIELQNHETNLTQDHVTITGFFTTAEQFQRHIEKLQRRIDHAAPHGWDYAETATR